MPLRNALSRSVVLTTLSLVCTVGCGDGSHPQPTLTPSTESEPLGACSAVLRSYEGATAQHFAPCSDIEYGSSPPVFGDHYPNWAAYRSYDFAVPLGFVVHDLEHGAVAFFYDCPDGCDDEVAEVQAFIDALPDDPRCSAAVRVQVVLVPRPGLGSRWAASAWGYSVSADCFDADVFGQFYAAHHGQGPEDLCIDGVEVTPDTCP